MLGIGYILATVIVIVDLLLSSYGGGLLIAISMLSLFVLQGWINRKRLNAYKCEQRFESAAHKLRLCELKLKNKVKGKHHYFPNIDVYIIPGNDANSTLLDWKTIGVTEGALRMEPRVLEALIAHEYGHVMNGDIFLANVATINFFGLFFILLINHFVFIAVIYLLVILLFIIGIVRFNIVSVFVSERLTSFIRHICETILKWIIGISGVIAQFSRKHSDYIADSFAVNLGYGLYLKRFLKYYIDAMPGRRPLSPLRNKVTVINKRIIKIEARMRKQTMV